MVVFFNKFLFSVKYNYKIYDKKMLAIIWALKEWQYFMESTPIPIEIWTDYKNLEYFITAKKLNCRQAQWLLYLARFDFVLHYCPSKSMDKPNILYWYPATTLLDPCSPSHDHRFTSFSHWPMSSYHTAIYHQGYWTFCLMFHLISMDF